jgi:pantoate--beta-alanine ligase
VVTKLFTIVRPHLAVFGEKDFQQLALVRRLSTDLNLGVDIIAMPTVREPDGLAMSTRNRYLSPPDRERALSLSRALLAAREAAVAGELDVAALVAKARAILDPAVDKLDYVEIRNADTLAPMERLDVPGVMLVAAFVGATRLIDNMRL